MTWNDTSEGIIEKYLRDVYRNDINMLKQKDAI